MEREGGAMADCNLVSPERLGKKMLMLESAPDPHNERLNDPCGDWDG